MIADVTWWPGWREMVGQRLPFLFVVALGVATVCGYVTAFRAEARVKRRDRELELDRELERKAAVAERKEPMTEERHWPQGDGLDASRDVCTRCGESWAATCHFRGDPPAHEEGVARAAVAAPETRNGP